MLQCNVSTEKTGKSILIIKSMMVLKNQQLQSNINTYAIHLFSHIIIKNRYKITYLTKTLVRCPKIKNLLKKSSKLTF